MVTSISPSRNTSFIGLNSEKSYSLKSAVSTKRSISSCDVKCGKGLPFFCSERAIAADLLGMHVARGNRTGDCEITYSADSEPNEYARVTVNIPPDGQISIFFRRTMRDIVQYSRLPKAQE